VTSLAGSAPAEAPTHLGGTGGTARGSGRTLSRSPTSPSAPAVDGGRFPPGTLIADRYRIVGMLGRGGMGEVYRAEDLRLDQQVALKFLPESVATDPARLAQFHNEVRVARQVTHKNVCRLHDIGEVDGRTFLSMEYVDGEDLATLLRRIGRLPPDKGVEIARQLCAGLAAAHERGVLHRDLKPANVMLDGEGCVRLTDFGIAGTAEQVRDSRAGTPGYMAPEQLTGGKASVQSDLFALGLVLYEIFTGKRAIQARTLDELLQVHERGLDLSATTDRPDIDPAIDRAIRRCLAPDPSTRPTSALAVAAALPGGDPLAAALAAGETPSPEMVAASGRGHAVATRTAVALVTTFALGLAALAWFFDRHLLIRSVPLEKPPVVLEDRARTILGALGYTSTPRDEASGMAYNTDFLRYVRAERRGADRWAWLPTGRTPAVFFSYRSSPRLLVPYSPSPRPTPGDPPLNVSGMTHVVLDPQGRLLQLSVVPPQVDAATEEQRRVPDWTRLFEAAGLPRDRFTESPPQWNPPHYADARAAWTGTLPEFGDVPIRVEAAAYRGQPVGFQIVGPWTRPTRMTEAPRTPLGRAAVAVTSLMVAGVLLTALWASRNNLRSGRGDRRGAARLALAVIVLLMASWAFGAHHVGDAAVEINEFFIAVSLALLNAAFIWIAYMALEPLVRRRWPASLVGWTRMLSGRWNDPLVGRDVLIGLASGVVFTLLVRLTALGSAWVGLPPNTPSLVNPDPLGGGLPVLVSSLLAGVNSVISTALVVILLVALIRSWVRWPPAAYALSAVLFALMIGAEVISGEMPVFETTIALGIAAMLAAVAWRFGVLALAVTLLVAQVVYHTPVVADVSRWYSPLTIVGVAVLVAMAAAAFVVARGGEPLLGGRVQER
jgi:serine/threonine-protein kinase